MAPSLLYNVFQPTGQVLGGKSILKKLHSIHFTLNNTNFMKKGEAVLVTNTEEFRFNVQ